MMLTNTVNNPNIIRSYSIRRQLLIYLFLSIFIFLLVFSISILWLTQKGAGEVIISNAWETTHVLAEQSALALVTENAENAESALQQVLSFPDVIGAGLVTKNGDMLSWQGDVHAHLHFSKLDWTKNNTKEIFFEDTDHWHIASEVVLKANSDDESELDLYELSEEKTALIKRMQKISEAWKPYRSFASRYLWSWKRENP